MLVFLRWCFGVGVFVLGFDDGLFVLIMFSCWCFLCWCSCAGVLVLACLWWCFGVGVFVVGELVMVF